MSFKAYYVTMPCTLDQQISSRNLFLLFLNNAGISYVESREMFMDGCVEIAKKYKPAIIAHSEYWLEVAKGEEQFMAKIKTLVHGSTEPPATPPDVDDYHTKDTDRIEAGLPLHTDMEMSEHYGTDKDPRIPPPDKTTYSIEAKLKSSNIDTMHYAPAQGLTDGRDILRVKFTSGDVYEYYDVPPDIAEGLKNAHSPGGFFATHIRGSFKFKKLD